MLPSGEIAIAVMPLRLLKFTMQGDEATAAAINVSVTLFINEESNWLIVEHLPVYIQMAD